MSVVPPVSTPAPPYRAAPLRIACVQYDVKLGKVEENALKVKAMTARLAPGSVDLLVLPEMALSGYMFTSSAAVQPYLEKPKTGPTASLVLSLATRLRCHVIAGYPEALGVDDAKGTQKEVEAEGLGIGYNSAVNASPSGDIIGNYRKTFRFETDKTWAREGAGFQHIDLPEPLGRVALGICMDLNPRDFIAPWDAFELANYCVDIGADILVVPMNWLDPAEQDDSASDEDEEERRYRRDPEAPSESNLNYWAARLTPLHDPTPNYASSLVSQAAEPVKGKGLVFVACNRVGVEAGTRFCGTSCVMTVDANPSRIELLDVCNRTEERVLVTEVV